MSQSNPRPSVILTGSELNFFQKKVFLLIDAAQNFCILDEGQSVSKKQTRIPYDKIASP